MEIESVVARLAEQVERRFYGKYRGFVVDNVDPERLGRLKLTVPSVLGDEVVSGWAMPCVPYGGGANQGFLFTPEVGAGVWVEFEEGDLEFPIWVGTFWSKPGGESELPKPNEADGAEQDGVQDPPTRKIIKTAVGHTLQFEDADGDERVTLVEAVHGHLVTLDRDGIKISDGVNKHEFVLGKEIRITDGANPGNEILMAGKGVTCKVINGNTITMAGSGIDLNGGTRICLEGLVNWLKTHQHVGNMGAPTPLFPADMATLNLQTQSPEGGILSDKVKAK